MWYKPLTKRQMAMQFENALDVLQKWQRYYNYSVLVYVTCEYDWINDLDISYVPFVEPILWNLRCRSMRHRPVGPHTQHKLCVPPKAASWKRVRSLYAFIGRQYMVQAKRGVHSYNYSIFGRVFCFARINSLGQNLWSVVVSVADYHFLTCQLYRKPQYVQR